MRILVGMEINNEGRDQAWALDFPGCFAYGNNSSEAVIKLAQELVAYETWVGRHVDHSWVKLEDFDVRIIETWQVFTMNDQYELEDGAYAVNAWFRHDWKPLTDIDIARGTDLMRWSREDLLDVVATLSDDVLDRKYQGERWSIRGILKHVANAEWWYLDRLNLAGDNRGGMPKDAIDRLDWVRTYLNDALSKLSGSEMVYGKEGEFWSPRKLLRRVLWHEIDHTRHILKLIGLNEQL